MHLPSKPTTRQEAEGGYILFVANDTAIATYCLLTLSLYFGLHLAFLWLLIIADVTKPIIGVDFLHHYSILVDVCHRCLVDQVTSLVSLDKTVCGNLVSSIKKLMLAYQPHTPSCSRITQASDQQVNLVTPPNMTQGTIFRPHQDLQSSANLPFSSRQVKTS